MSPASVAPIMLVPIGVLGLVFGSFITALSHRLPRGESVAHGRSRCPACDHALTATDLVPVLSWIVQKGACRYCHASVSWRYPAIEVTTMGLFLAAGLVAQDTVHLILLLLMTPPMMTLAVIDLEHQRLPNSLLIALTLFALAWRWSGDQDVLMGLMAAVAVMGAGVLLDAGFKVLKGRTGIGMGDAKLFAVAALALPLGPFLLFATLAGALGVVFGVLWRWRWESPQFPFAPSILTAYWLCLTVGTPLMHHLIIFRQG